MEKKLIFSQSDAMYAIAGSSVLTALVLFITF